MNGLYSSVTPKKWFLYLLDGKSGDSRFPIVGSFVCSETVYVTLMGKSKKNICASILEIRQYADRKIAKTGKQLP